MLPGYKEAYWMNRVHFLDEQRMLPGYEEASWMTQGCFQDTKRNPG
jgi:hypothetical protein